MKKNINYIIGLISVICICVLMNKYKSKKEGFNEISCVAMNSSSMLTDKSIQGMQSIMQDGIDADNYTQEYSTSKVGPFLSMIVTHLVNIDKFTAFLNSKPTFFTDLFNNQNLQDPDFIIIFNFYNSFNFALHTIRMTIIKVNSNKPYNGNRKLPISSGISIDVKHTNDYYNNNAKIIVNSMQRILDNINNNTKNTAVDILDAFAINMSDTYVAIMSIDKCSQYLLKDTAQQQLDIIFPFLDLIRMYCYNLSTLLAKHIVIPLNYKLKNGQIRIKPEVPKPLTNDGGSSVPTSSALVSPTGTLANTNALFIGAGATYA